MASEKYFDGTNWVQVTGLTVYVSGGGSIITKNFFNCTAAETTSEYGTVTASVTYASYIGE